MPSVTRASVRRLWAESADGRRKGRLRRIATTTVWNSSSTFQRGGASW